MKTICRFSALNFSVSCVTKWLKDIMIFSLPSSDIHLSNANEYHTSLLNDSISCKMFADFCVKSSSMTSAIYNSKSLFLFNCFVFFFFLYHHLPLNYQESEYLSVRKFFLATIEIQFHRQLTVTTHR